MTDASVPHQQLDVIGVGFGRTGTSSLRAALERLGFGPCYHMWEVIYDVERARQWRRVADGGPPDWTQIYRGYRSAVDWPGAAYWRELVDEFPEAKVVLTVRDPYRWYESARKTIFQFPLRRHDVWERMGYGVVSRLNPTASEVPAMLDRALWDRVFEGRAFDGRDLEADRAYAVERFQRHIDEVIAYVPANRLLVFDVSEGWEPLCRFLGVAVPTEPFPQLNETENFGRMLADRRRVAQRPLVLGAAAAAAGGIAAALIAAAAGLSVGAAAMAGVGTVAATGTGAVAATAGRPARRGPSVDGRGRDAAYGRPERSRQAGR